MFKVNNKTTECHWSRSGVFIVWTYFTPFYTVSTADFEQVNVSWVVPSRLPKIEYSTITYEKNRQ